MRAALPALALILPLLAAETAVARTLLVGPDQALTSPSAAARVAQDGDTVLIEPGEYYDCAVWARNRLTIAGTGPDTVITDATCQGKALFVVNADEVTIRDLTLQRARVPDGNGAGIRMQGSGLTVERVTFRNNQVGLLAGGPPDGTIRLTATRFEGGGVGGDRPTFAVLTGALALLRIEDSVFDRVRGGQVRSEATRVEFVNNDVRPGADGARAALVLSGDGVTVTDNRFVFAEAGGSGGPAGAVLATGAGPIDLRRNRMQNDSGTGAALLLNWTGSTPKLEANEVRPPDIEVSSGGAWRHRASRALHDVNDALHAIARSIKNGIQRL